MGEILFAYTCHPDCFITYGDDETIGVSVSGVGDGAVPTGNVTVVVTDSSGAVVATFTEEALTDGSVELKVTGLDAGEYNVAITYNGNTYANGAKVVEKTISATSSTTCRITFDSLPRGNYTIRETASTGYTATTASKAANLNSSSITVAFTNTTIKGKVTVNPYIYAICKKLISV